MNTSVGAMYNDLQGLGVDVAELKLKANTAIAFMEIFWSLTVRAVRRLLKSGPC